MQTQPNPHRVKVERGIYYRERAAGRRYEIAWQDSDGRWRFQTVDGGLREARQARATIVARLGRGERVAPSKRTVAEVADAWLSHKDDLGKLRPRTRERYQAIIEHHVKPRIGSQRATRLTGDDLVALMAEMRRGGSAEATIRKTVTLLGTILGHALRRGWIATNPVRELERDERPGATARPMRTLTRTEIADLLGVARPTYRTLLATAIFTGLRYSELLGLTWSDVDFDANAVHVRKQLDRWQRDETPRRVDPKTPQAIRDVVLSPALAELLREHRRLALERGLARPEDLVFLTELGGPLNQRNATRRGLDHAAKKAGLNADGRQRVRFHDLRHTFASLLIAEGLNVVFVSRQLGHADPAITLRVYAHLFDQAEHAERAIAALDDALVRSQSSTGGKQRASSEAEVTELSGLREQRETAGTKAAR